MQPGNIEALKVKSDGRIRNGNTRIKVLEERGVDVNGLDNGVHHNRRRGLTPSTTLRLAKYFGTSADFWMDLQLRWDLSHAKWAEAHELKKIKRVED